MNTKVSEIMEKDVYFCHVSSTIGDVLEIMVEKKVSGLPIVDDNSHVVGFISDGDIMKYIGKQRPRTVDAYTYMFILYDEKSFEQKIEDLINLNVMSIATKKVVSVKASSALDEAANILGDKKIKLAPVVVDDKLVGIISRSTITRYIVGNYLRIRKTAK
ncbi:MAG: CBS domain-containing protein [Clostridia bacterium]|jgi:CBS domain-containing protein|nr:CBS domain-containing protein [Clostridia bacterium]